MGMFFTRSHFLQSRISKKKVRSSVIWDKETKVNWSPEWIQMLHNTWTICDDVTRHYYLLDKFNMYITILTSAKKCNLSRCWQAKRASNSNEAGPGSKVSQVFGCFNILRRLSRASDLFQKLSWKRLSQ